jgi:hypothetical protein
MYRLISRQNLELFDTENDAVDNRQWLGDMRMQNFGLNPEHNPPPPQIQLSRASRKLALEYWAFSMHHTVKHFACPEVFPRLVYRARP